MNNPWAQLPDIYGQGLSRQSDIAQAALEKSRSLPEYFMQGFMSARQRAQQEEAARADAELKRSHANYYNESQTRDRNTAQKNEDQARLSAVRELNDLKQEYLQGAPGNEGNKIKEDNIRAMTQYINKRWPGTIEDGFAPPASNNSAPSNKLDDWLSSGEKANAEGQIGFDTPMVPQPYRGTQVETARSKQAGVDRATEARSEHWGANEKLKAQELAQAKAIAASKIAVDKAKLASKETIARMAMEMRSKSVGSALASAAVARQLMAARIEALKAKGGGKSKVASLMFSKLYSDPIRMMNADPESMVRDYAEIEDAISEMESGPDEPTSVPMKPQAKKPAVKPTGKPAVIGKTATGKRVFAE